MNKSFCRLISIFMLLMIVFLCTACSNNKKLKADAYINSGNTYISQGQNDLAISDFSKAIELDSINSISYYNRGNVYYSMGQYDLAIKDLSEAIELNRMNEAFYYKRGNFYKSYGQNELATLDLNKAIQLRIRK